MRQGHWDSVSLEGFRVLSGFDIRPHVPESTACTRAHRSRQAFAILPACHDEYAGY